MEQYQVEYFMFIVFFFFLRKENPCSEVGNPGRLQVEKAKIQFLRNFSRCCISRGKKLMPILVYIYNDIFCFI